MTKIDIFSGFLGAGKTTLIKKLLDQAIAAIKTAQNNGGGVTFYSDDNTAGN